MADAVEDLEEDLEVAELDDGGGVEGERGGVALVHQERGGVEPRAIVLAHAAHAEEVAREMERGVRLGGPRVDKEGGDPRGWGAVVLGTTWKKKSRSNVGDAFSVSRFAGGGLADANASSTDGSAAAARRNPTGGPTRLQETAARRHAAIGSRVGLV